jgi:pyruvate kinase
MVVVDLAGEKFRLGDFQTDTQIDCVAGQRVRLVCGRPFSLAHQTAPAELPIRDHSFLSYLTEGVEVIVGDGSALLRTLSVEQDSALLEVLSNGTIQHNRGLTIVRSGLEPKALTQKDIKDLEVALQSADVDAVALSFVKDQDEVETVRAMARKFQRRITVIAKIETLRGVENACAIAGAADFLLAARGDLALTMPWTELPSAVQSIADAARANSIQWILATQIAEGLHRFSMLTRAEICDLANWLSKGCSGVLLSFETAFGPRPVEAVEATSHLMQRWYSKDANDSMIDPTCARTSAKPHDICEGTQDGGSAQT